ncbi:MAG TPA: ABC transporter ATP-binding protein [Burkholderiales bacterium]|nr:ABC transporter ATP-binding protein [Burkholderiales bacterium]
MRLTADALTLGFPGRVLCQDLSLALFPGQCWAVLGNNGSGKTTLMHALAGVRRPLAGSVRVDDAPLAHMGAAARARRIGLLLQEEPIEFWGSVLDYVSLGRYPHRRSLLGYDPEAERLAHDQLVRVDLETLAGQTLSHLSGGERQRARLALVLTQDPAIYLLDEPLQHLDLRHQMQALDCFTGLARAQGRAVMMVLHDPGLARRRCDHAVLLYDAGPPLAGPTERVLTPENLERLYGVPVPL